MQRVYLPQGRDTFYSAFVVIDEKGKHVTRRSVSGKIYCLRIQHCTIRLGKTASVERPTIDETACVLEFYDPAYLCSTREHHRIVRSPSPESQAMAVPCFALLEESLTAK
jgi:hypothetical protein